MREGIGIALKVSQGETFFAIGMAISIPAIIFIIFM